MKLFNIFRRKNKVEQEENVQNTSVQEENAQEAHEESVGDDNKQEDSVEETASEESAQDSINDSEVNEANKGEKADKDSDDTENEDDELSDEPDDDIEEDEAGDDEIDEDDTEEEDETEDEEDEVEEDDEEDDGEEREHREISFDYEQFEEDLCTTFEEFMKGYLDRKEDMYIFSVNYFPEYTTTVGVNANSYSYFNEKVKSDPSCYGDFKYCEEEWEVQEWFDAPSKQLQIYFDQLDEEYEDDEDTHDELYEEHRDRIIDICKNVMKRIKETDTVKAYPQMLLNVYVWEVIDGEDAVEIFKDINGDAIPDDYFEFVDSWK